MVDIGYVDVYRRQLLYEAGWATEVNHRGPIRGALCTLLGYSRHDTMTSVYSCMLSTSRLPEEFPSCGKVSMGSK